MSSYLSFSVNVILSVFKCNPLKQVSAGIYSGLVVPSVPVGFCWVKSVQAPKTVPKRPSGRLKTPLTKNLKWHWTQGKLVETTMSPFFGFWSALDTDSKQKTHYRNTMWSFIVAIIFKNTSACHKVVLNKAGWGAEATCIIFTSCGQRF